MPTSLFYRSSHHTQSHCQKVGRSRFKRTLPGKRKSRPLIAETNGEIERAMKPYGWRSTTVWKAPVDTACWLNFNLLTNDIKTNSKQTKAEQNYKRKQKLPVIYYLTANCCWKKNQKNIVGKYDEEKEQKISSCHKLANLGNLFSNLPKKINMGFYRVQIICKSDSMSTY